MKEKLFLFCFLGLVNPVAVFAAEANNRVATGIGAIFLIILMLFWVAFIAFWVFAVVFWIMMIVDVATRKNWDNENDKTVWILIVVLTGIVGALIYYFVIRRKLGPASAESKKEQ